MTRPVRSSYPNTVAGNAQWAQEQYLHGAEGLPVQTDQDARVALDNSAHTAKTNAQLATGLNHVSVNTTAVKADVYTGGNIVTVAANRAGVDMYPEDAQNTEDLEQEVLVGAEVQAGTIFAHGGSILGAYDGNAGPYLDPAFLAEASKLTGEKFF